MIVMRITIKTTHHIQNSTNNKSICNFGVIDHCQIPGFVDSQIVDVQFGNTKEES